MGSEIVVVVGVEVGLVCIPLFSSVFSGKTEAYNGVLSEFNWFNFP